MDNDRKPLMIMLALATLMAFTRSHHVADLTHLPDASWALFFAAGFYLRGGRAFAALFFFAVAIDVAAVTWGGVDDFCVSPAYGLLLPAYGALFLAGRWYATQHRLAWSTLVLLVATACGAALVCEVISSAGFYLFSGRFTSQSVAGFGERFIAYFPGALQSAGFWLALVVIVHAALAVTSRRTLRAHR